MASVDADGGRAPTHQCGAAISIKALRDAVHAYAKSKNIPDLSKKKDVNTKNRTELVGLIHGWSDFPIDACCAARDVPRGRATVEPAAAATEVAEDRQEAPLETSSAEYSPVFVSTERLVELLNGAGKASTGDRKAMLSRCVKAGLIAQADADVRAEYFTLDELRRRLLAHNVELPGQRQGRASLIGLCLQHRLITSDEAEAKTTRKPATKMSAEERAKLKANVRDGDPPMIVVKNSLRGLLRFAGFDSDGAKRSDQVVRAIVDAADRTHLLVTHAYQLVKQVKLRQYATEATMTMPTADEYRAAMYAVSKEGAPNDNHAMADAFADAYVDTLLPEGFEGDASERLAEARRHLPSRSGLSNVIIFQSVDMATNAMNSPMMHYADRLRQWVNVAFDVKARAEAAHAQPGTKEERKARAAAVRARFRNVKDDLLSDAEELKSDPEFHRWVVQQRADLHPPRPLQEGSVHYDVKVRPGDYLRQSIALTQRMQLAGARGFHALPHRSSFVPGYITMDTRALREVLGIKSKTKGKDGGEGEDDGQSWDVKQGIWRDAGFGVHTRSFRRGAKGGSRYVFRHTLVTDGVGASVVLVRSDLRDKVRNIRDDNDKGLSNKARLNAAKMRRAGLRGAEALAGKESYVGVQHAAEWLADGKRIVTLDPGVLDALYCGEDAGDGRLRTLRTLRYTLAQRLRESKRTRYKTLRTQAKEQQGAVHAGRTVDQCYSALGGDTHSCKTVDRDAYDAMLRERNAMLPEMAEHHAGAHLAGRKNLDGGMYRRLRWNAWVNRQRADDAFMQRFRRTFGPPSTTLVVFGDWGASTTLRGWVSTPKGASWRRLFRTHGYTVVLNDEGRTTKCCSSCHAGEATTFLVAPDPRKNPRRDGMPRPDRKVHGLLKCEGCDTHHNRNKNAVANQLRAAMAALRGEERPEGLRRKQQHQ
jgi:hypothetical protein